MATRQNRDIDSLNQDFKIKVELRMEHLRYLGIFIFWTEMFRSKERQKELYAIGRTKPWKKVTWTLDSKHNYWLAIDIAFQPSIHWHLYNVWDFLRNKIAEIAKKYEIDWSYDLFKKEKAHFQCNWVKIANSNWLINYKYHLPFKRQDDKIVQYEQETNDCSDYANIGAISDLYNMRLTSEQLDSLNNFLVSKWFTQYEWDSVYMVAPYVAEWRRRNVKWQNPFAFAFPLNTKETNKALTYWYSIVGSRWTSSNVVKDWLDWVLGWIYDIRNWRHAVRWRLDVNEKKLIEINNKYDSWEINVSEYRNWAAHIKKNFIKPVWIVFM